MDAKTRGAGITDDLAVRCPERITTGLAAEYCGVHKVTVLRWIQRGYLAAFRLPDGHYRIRREDLVGFMAERGIPPVHRGIITADDHEG